MNVQLLQHYLNFFYTFVKNELSIFAWVWLWILYSVFLTYMFIAMLIPEFLDYCSYVLKSSEFILPPTLFSFCKIV